MRNPQSIPREIFFFLSVHTLMPWSCLEVSAPSAKAETSGPVCSPERARAFPLVQMPMPFSSPTALLTTKTHCGKGHLHWARSPPLHTFKCIFQFHSVFLFSYNKVELLALTPLCLPRLLSPYPPRSNRFSAVSTAKSPPATHVIMFCL